MVAAWRGAFLSAALLCAACYDVDEPAEWACSAAEPQCPDGYQCDGQRCRVAACLSFDTNWVCDQPALTNTAVATCGARKITCTVPAALEPFACTCKDGDKLTDCGKSASLLGCWAAKDAFVRGCCVR